MTRKQHRKMIETAANFGTLKRRDGVIHELSPEEQKQAEIVLKIMDHNAAMKKAKYEAMKKAKLRIYKFMSPLSGKNKAQRQRVLSGFQCMMQGNKTIVVFDKLKEAI